MTNAGGVRASHCVQSVQCSTVNHNAHTWFKLTSSNVAINRVKNSKNIVKNRICLPELKISKYFKVVLPIFWT